jgi:hypothetical protein
LGENLCQGFNKKDNVDQNKKNEINKKTQKIKEIFAEDLRDEIKNLKETFNYKYI